MSISIGFNAALLASLYMAYREHRMYFSHPKAVGEKLALDYYRERYHDEDVSAVVETRDHLRVKLLKDGRAHKVLLVVDGQVYEANDPGRDMEGTTPQEMPISR